ncbi:MAG: di-heme-cytochrome C peroxidase [Stappiaceae bacterium]
MLRPLQFFKLLSTCLFLGLCGTMSAQSADTVQGWTDDQRERYYHLPQGSRMMPYKWFRALENEAGTALFSSRENLQIYGFIPSPYTGKSNPDGLPIGFAIEEVHDGGAFRVGETNDGSAQTGKKKAIVGLTCAACHTADVTVRGKTIRYDGAPAMLDFDTFYQDLAQAVNQTLFEPARFEKFAAKVLDKPTKQAIAQLEQEFAVLQTEMTADAIIRKPVVHSGFGRLDGLTQIANALAVRDQMQPLNLRGVAAPVSYPSLWLTPQLEFVQWNPIAASPIGRNAGEVMGVFGSAVLSGNGKDLYRSTLLLENLYELEDLVSKLEAPAWNESIQGKIDRALAEAGALLFKQNCAGCHNEMPYRRTDPKKNFFGKTFIEIGRVDYKAVGTDPVYVQSMIDRYVLTNEATAPLFKDAPLVPVSEYYLGAVGAIVGKAMVAAKLTQQEEAEWNGFRTRKMADGKPGPYLPPSYQDLKASPLEAVWATGPYLHNGSVPTIYELLSPEEERRKVFWTGGSDLDLDKLGYVSDEAPGLFRFDTSIPGNGNQGHNYPKGGLTHDQRLALIEYLKGQ